MHWADLLHLGSLSLTLPAGGAITAWLLAARAWRAAFGWSLVFGLSLLLVAATKIAFMGWATGLPALQFKAVSGHAAGFTCVFPTLCWLLVRPYGPRLRIAAPALGLVVGALLAAALVHAGEHTPAEALAGWLVGLAATVSTIHLADDAPTPRVRHALPAAALAFAATAWLVYHVPIGYLMVKAALVLSGNPFPTPWDSCG